MNESEIPAYIIIIVGVIALLGGCVSAIVAYRIKEWFLFVVAILCIILGMFYIQNGTHEIAWGEHNWWEQIGFPIIGLLGLAIWWERAWWEGLDDE